MAKRILALLLALIFVLACMAGCGTPSTKDGGDEKKEDTKKEDTKKEDAKKEEEPSGEDAEEGESIHLVLNHIGFNQEQIDSAKKNSEDNGVPLDGQSLFYMSVTEDMAKDYPDYDIEYVDWGWSEALDQKQRALIAAGNIPDLVSGETFIPEYAREGILEPLPQDIVDMCDPSFMVYDPEGNPVAIAYCTSVFLLFYNKDLMAAAGLDPEAPPTTWAEWKEMSDAITAAGNGEFYGGGIPSFPHAGGSLRATPFFRQCGTDFAKDGVENLSDPALQDTLQFIRDMNKNIPDGVGNGSDEAPMWNAFHEQKVAFVVDGGWQLAQAAAYGVNVGCAQLPTKDGTVGNCLVGTVYVAVPKGAAHPDASFDAIRECLKAEHLKHWISDGRLVPTYELLDDASIWNTESLSGMRDAVLAGQVEGLCVFDNNNSSAWEIINQQVLQRATVTDDPIADICAEGAQQIAYLE